MTQLVMYFKLIQLHSDVQINLILQRGSLSFYTITDIINIYYMYSEIWSTNSGL